MFTLDDLQVARGLTGVYFLYNKDKQLVYIGKSVDVYVRILEHKLEQKKDFHFFKVAGVKKLAFAELLEIYLIEKYKTHFKLLNKASIGTTFENFYFHLPTMIKNEIELDSIKDSANRLSSFITTSDGGYNSRFDVNKPIENEDFIKELLEEL